MIKDFKLSEHFTFFEMTKTNNFKLLQKNREIAQKYTHNLTKTVNLLERIRRKFENKIIIVNSGFRYKKLNQIVGGSKTSNHLKGFAVDFYIPELNTLDVFNKIKFSNINFHKLIYYPYHNFIHISVATFSNDHKTEIRA